MPKFLANLTHWLIVALSAAYGFSQTAAGQAIVKQYPQLSGALVALGILAAVYHVPTSPNVQK